MTAHSRELETEKLLQLSDQVNRIANNLARLSAEARVTDVPAALLSAADEALPEIKIETVRTVIRARRLRDNFFDGDLFADPAWDILLDLFQAELSQRRVAVSSLCIAASVPATTAIRWIKSMIDKGLIVKQADPLDGRRQWVALTEKSKRAMCQYFAHISDSRTA